MMNRKKILSISLAFVSAFSMTAGIVSFAVDNHAEANESSMRNSFINLSVASDKQQGEYLRYRLDTVGGQISSKEDDNKNLTYDHFFSGYTTVNINGQNYMYGRGTDVSAPTFNAAEKSHTSSQKFGDVVIEQKLSFAEGFTPGYEDMLKISYRVVDAGEGETIGVRILIDPKLDDDDTASLSVDNVGLRNEAVFNDKLPRAWSAAKADNTAVSAFGKIAEVPKAPNSITYADWDKLYDSVWDYEPDINKPISDAAVTVRWNPNDNAVGREFTTYYGIKNNANTGGGNDVTVKAPRTSDSFPVASVLLGVISIAAATSCVIIRRKEMQHEA